MDHFHISLNGLDKEVFNHDQRAYSMALMSVLPDWWPEVTIVSSLFSHQRAVLWDNAAQQYYSMFTLRKPRSPLILNGESGIL